MTAPDRQALERGCLLHAAELREQLRTLDRPVPHCEVRRLAVDGYWMLADERPHERTPEELWQALAARSRHEAHRAQSAAATAHADDVATFVRNAHILRMIARYAELQTEPAPLPAA